MKQLVITGGEGGLARAIGEAFCDAHWQVFAPGRKDLDVSNLESVKEYFTDHQPDLLVCCAGITRDAPLLITSESAWEEVWKINYQGAAVCARAVLPVMLRRASGQIVFISSHSAIHPPAGQIAYATAKAALLGLTTSLAKSHGPSGIRVNALLPGFLETSMTAAVSPKRRAEIMADHALASFNTPAAVAGFIRYLQDYLPQTSGQIFQLDSRLA